MSLNLPTFHSDELNDKRVAEYEAMLEKEKLLKAQRRFEATGVPSKFYNKTIDTYIAETQEEKHNKDITEQFMKAPKNKVLIMCGNNGNGKTHLASSILRNNDGLYITSCDLCIEYESATSYNAPRTRQALLLSMLKPDVLIIDECRKYTLHPELEKFILSYIGNARYENNKATVYVTNDSKSSFVEFLGKSTFDRLVEVCTTIEFTQESKRWEYRDEGKRTGISETIPER